MSSKTVLRFQSVIGIFFLFHTFYLSNSQVLDSNLVIKSAERSIDLQSQLTKITAKLVIENGGKGTVRNFLYAFDSKQKEQLSSVTAHLREPGRTELKVTEIKIKDHPYKIFYSIELRDPLQPGRSVNVDVESVSTHQLVPYPKEIKQKEKQLIKYTGNVYLFSPYVVTKQSTTIVLPSRNIESYTKIKPVSQSDSTITYGPYEKKQPFSSEEITVHFENNNKFLTVTKMDRVIEISHWGNIAVEETIELLHTGALLKGSFSRYV